MHVFCALWLVPEATCLDYATLEPWNLDGVAQWRKDARCRLCDQVSCSYRRGNVVDLLRHLIAFPAELVLFLRYNVSFSLSRQTFAHRLASPCVHA